MVQHDQDVHRQALLLRLRKIEGQVRGIQKMISEEEPCESIAQQMAAARKALDRAFFEMMACLLEQASSGGVHTQSDLRKVMDLIRKYA